MVSPRGSPSTLWDARQLTQLLDLKVAFGSRTPPFLPIIAPAQCLTKIEVVAVGQTLPMVSPFASSSAIYSSLRVLVWENPMIPRRHSLFKFFCRYRVAYDNETVLSDISPHRVDRTPSNRPATFPLQHQKELGSLGPANKHTGFIQCHGCAGMSHECQHS